MDQLDGRAIIRLIYFGVAWGGLSWAILAYAQRRNRTAGGPSSPAAHRRMTGALSVVFLPLLALGPLSLGLAGRTLALHTLGATADGVVEGQRTDAVCDREGYCRTFIRYSFTPAGHSGPALVAETRIDDSLIALLRPQSRVSVLYLRAWPAVSALAANRWVGQLVANILLVGFSLFFWGLCFLGWRKVWRDFA